jgi:hypothetical protein
MSNSTFLTTPCTCNEKDSFTFDLTVPLLDGAVGYEQHCSEATVAQDKNIIIDIRKIMIDMPTILREIRAML